MTEREQKLEAEVKRLEQVVAHYAEGQVWYVNALEVLSPFRFEVHDFLNGAMEVEDNRNNIILSIQKTQLEALKKTAIAAEIYFAENRQ